MMLSLNFRVSTKLAIASGISLLFVGAMIVNEQLSGNSVAQIYNFALRQQEVVKNTSAGTTAIGNAQIALRDIRLAQSAAEVDKHLETLRAVAKDGRAHMEAAAKLAIDTDSQGKMDQVAGLFDQYAKVSEDLAVAKRAVLENQAQQVDAGDQMDQGLGRSRSVDGVRQFEQSRRVGVQSARGRAAVQRRAQRLLALYLQRRSQGRAAHDAAAADRGGVAAAGAQFDHRQGDPAERRRTARRNRHFQETVRNRREILDPARDHLQAIICFRSETRSTSFFRRSPRLPA